MGYLRKNIAVQQFHAGDIYRREENWFEVYSTLGEDWRQFYSSWRRYFINIAVQHFWEGYTFHQSLYSLQMRLSHQINLQNVVRLRGFSVLLVRLNITLIAWTGGALFMYLMDENQSKGYIIVRMNFCQRINDAVVKLICSSVSLDRCHANLFCKRQCKVRTLIILNNFRIMTNHNSHCVHVRLWTLGGWGLDRIDRETRSFRVLRTHSCVSL